MSYFEDILNEVDKGRLGLNQGLTTGISELDDLICGVQKSSYYLIGGETGTGKTAFADNCFIINPIQSILTNNSEFTFKVFYYSLEINRNKKLTKWICHRLYNKYGIITDVNEVLSKGKNRISDDIYNSVLESKKFIERISEFVLIDDSPCNPTKILKQVREYCEENGKIEEKKTINLGKEYTYETYTPNNEKQIVLLVVDHIGLLRKESNLEKKGNIDRLSEYVIQLRNKYKVSALLVSQLNRSLSEIERQKHNELTVQMNDFKNTGNTQEDSEFVFGLFNPSRYNIQNYSGYDLMKYDLKKYFRSLVLLKNRDGDDNIKMGLNFLGDCGYFRKLPIADKMGNSEYMKANFKL